MRNKSRCRQRRLAAHRRRRKLSPRRAVFHRSHVVSTKSEQGELFFSISYSATSEISTSPTRILRVRDHRGKHYSLFSNFANCLKCQIFLLVNWLLVGQDYNKFIIQHFTVTDYNGIRVGRVYDLLGFYYSHHCSGVLSAPASDKYFNLCTFTQFHEIISSYILKNNCAIQLLLARDVRVFLFCVAVSLVE